MTKADRLPWVVPPCPGEWFGHWLLRIGSVYGLRVRALLALAGVTSVTGVRVVEPSWARLGDGLFVDWSGMSALLGEPLSRLRRMQMLVSPPSRWTQLGCCPLCLRSDLRDGGTLYWRRAWMDPYVTVCARHHRPLRPVDARAVRPLVKLDKTTLLLNRLADEDATDSAPPMTSSDVRSLLQLQVRMMFWRSHKAAATTGWTPLRHHVDKIAVRLHRVENAGLTTLVPIPDFGGWLAGVRDLQARQHLLQGVAQQLPMDDVDEPSVATTVESDS